MVTVHIEKFNDGRYRLHSTLYPVNIKMISNNKELNRYINLNPHIKFIFM